MRGLRVFAIAALTAVVGCILSVLASSYLTELYHVSNFEGGRGMLVVFFFAPLGLIAGFVVGLVVAILSGGAGFAGYAKAQGLAFAAAIGLAVLISGIAFMAAIIHRSSTARHSRSNLN